MKSNPARIIAAHFNTFYDQRNGKHRVGKIVFQVAAPLLAALSILWLHPAVNSAVSVALAVSSGFVAFSFMVLLGAVSSYSLRWADSAPAQGKDTTWIATIMGEITGSASYGILISVFASISFSLSATTGSILLAAGAFFAVNGILTLIMLTDRVLIVTKSRLTDAQTGASIR